MLPVQDFLANGYVVLPAERPEALHKLRQQIFEKAREIFGHDGKDVDAFFNHFHRLQITGPTLNELRSKLIQTCSQTIDSGTLVFEAFQNSILQLLGPDLLVQKTTNLVIQQPHDPNPIEVHRDAPGNSPYEMVVWLPLVNCYRTKAMYVLPRAKSETALQMLKGFKDNWSGFEAHCLSQGENVAVPYGSALFFWTGLLHGSRVNEESETRWSLNLRYKNLFSPNGLKEPFEFFNVFRLSPLTRLGLEFQRGELLP